MSQPSDTDGFVSRLCDVIEPVLKKHGIPLYGFPLGEDSADPKTLYAIGEGDRGDVTSDIAEAVLSIIVTDAIDWLKLVSDLDRCEHGRHEGDDCADCGGPSKGNPLWKVGHASERMTAMDATYERLWERFGGFSEWPDRLVGFGLDGVPICVPPRPAPGEPSRSPKSYRVREA